MIGALTIRRAQAGELPACADLYVRVLTETFTWEPAGRRRREDFFRYAQDEEIYVAVGEDGRILGLAGFYRRQNFLHSLYVAERGRGIGKALLDHVCAVADAPVSLKCQAKNLRAQAFYEREGFSCVERGRDGDVDWLRYLRG